MSRKSDAGSKREYAEWRRYAIEVLERERSALGGASEEAVKALSKTLRVLRRDSGFFVHRTAVSLAETVCLLPRLAAAHRVLPEPRKVEEWVKALVAHRSPQAIDFLAWKAFAAVRVAEEAAKTGDRRYVGIVRLLTYARRDSVPNLIAAILTMAPQLAGELIPPAERVRKWFERG